LAELQRVGRDHSDATVIFHSTIASRFGLSATEEKTMSLLQRHGAMTAGQIAVGTGLATASVTDLIDRLEHRGFARRRRDPHDRRRVIVEADAAHVSRVTALFTAPAQSLARLLARYSNTELAILLDFHRRNAARLKAETVKLRRHPSRPD
jgi:DNA-binding MarR family transcriptional regulator